MMGQLFMRLIREVMGGTASPNEQEVAEFVPAELLKLAKSWQRGGRNERCADCQCIKATNPL